MVHRWNRPGDTDPYFASTAASPSSSSSFQIINSKKKKNSFFFYCLYVLLYPHYMSINHCIFEIPVVLLSFRCLKISFRPNNQFVCQVRLLFAASATFSISEPSSPIFTSVSAVGSVVACLVAQSSYRLLKKQILSNKYAERAEKDKVGEGEKCQKKKSFEICRKLLWNEQMITFWYS